VGAISFGFLFVGVKQAGDVSSVAIRHAAGCADADTIVRVATQTNVSGGVRIAGIALAVRGSRDHRLRSARFLQYWFALALVVISCFFSSIGLIYVKSLKNIKALEIQAWVGTVSWPLMLGASFAFEHGQWHALANAGWPALSSLALHSGFSLQHDCAYRHVITW